MIARLLRPRPLLALLAVAALAVLVLWSFGRPAICTCGHVALWGPVGPEQSQMLADWYTPSHIVHGFLFYGLLHLAAPRWPVERRFVVALVVEAAWEVFENTPMVIDRYREATIALGYSGDSILNSVSDIAGHGARLLDGAALAGVGQRRRGAGARAGRLARHPRQSDAQHIDAGRPRVDAVRTWQGG